MHLPLHPPRALGPVGHEAGVFEDAEMLGDGGPTDRKGASQFSGFSRLRNAGAPQPQEDGAARAVAEGVELRNIVSNH